jgi:hypothetical protein
MAGCRSCSKRSPKVTCSQNVPQEKLGIPVRSNNPRYPRVFVGDEAVYVAHEAQLLVTVVEDCCDDSTDGFVLKSERVLRDSAGACANLDTFKVSKAPGDACWRLEALL